MDKGGECVYGLEFEVVTDKEGHPWHGHIAQREGELPQGAAECTAVLGPAHLSY